MTEIQQRTQCDGPRRPTAKRLALVLSRLPDHHEIRAVSVNGQSGEIVIESTHEDLEHITEAPTLWVEQP